MKTSSPNFAKTGVLIVTVLLGGGCLAHKTPDTGQPGPAVFSSPAASTDAPEIDPGKRWQLEQRFGAMVRQDVGQSFLVESTSADETSRDGSIRATVHVSSGTVEIFFLAPPALKDNVFWIKHGQCHQWDRPVQRRPEILSMQACAQNEIAGPLLFAFLSMAADSGYVLEKISPATLGDREVFVFEQREALASAYFERRRFRVEAASFTLLEQELVSLEDEHSYKAEYDYGSGEKGRSPGSYRLRLTDSRKSAIEVFEVSPLSTRETGTRMHRLKR